MEPEGPLSCSQEPSTGSYPENYIKVKLSVCVIKPHATLWQNGGITPHILNVGPRWKRTIRFMFPTLFSGEIIPVTLNIGSCVGSIANLEVVAKVKIYFPAGNETPVVSLLY
jgi:hypothetical protein